ncbi:MAG: hydrolase [Granulosicoccaceae bacterium]
MIITSKFSPSWWLSNPHLQTLYASKLSKRPPITFKTERLELPDGDFLDLCWSHKQSGQIVLLLHGLTGNITSAYAQGAFGQLEAAGMRPVFMHFRGCSGEPNRLARSYHSGETGDIGFMVNLLKERFPGVPISAAGFSLGANALLKYLGEQDLRCPFQSAIAVCPPLVLHVGANKLNKGIARGYQRFLIGLMRDQIEAKRALYPELDLPILTDEDNNFWKVDNNFTAPVHGFDDVHDYYKRCSSRPYLKSIGIPTHIIYALDDPFFTVEVIPTEAELSPSVTLELPTHGGHVGFIQGKIPFKPEYWLDGRIVEVLEGLG